MGHGYTGHGGWDWGIAGMLFPLLIWGGLFLAVALAARGWRLGGATGRLAPPERKAEDQALAILRDRYARGEIDSAEYEERRRWLLGDPPNL